MSIPVIDLNGNAYERGLQQGVKLGHHFEPMMEAFYDSELWKHGKPKWLPQAWVENVFRVAGFLATRDDVRKHLPAQARRIEGIAKGMGLDETYVWGIHFLEVIFCEAGASLAAPGGCTQFHATAAVTQEGRPLTGRNYDFPNMLLPYQAIRRETPTESGRLASISATHLPMAGIHQGLNEAGLVVACNNARLWRGEDFKYRGVPYSLLAMEALETCKTVAEAVRFITGFKQRTNAGFMGLMDASGDCKLVEFTASRCEVREPEAGGFILQTNHFQKMTEANLPEGTFWTVQGMEGLEYARSTKARLASVQKDARKAAGKVTLDTLKKALSSHGETGTGSDLTVCCHGDSGSTLSSFMVDPVKREFYFALGNPCENEYQKITFASAQKTAARPVAPKAAKPKTPVRKKAAAARKKPVAVKA